MRSSAIDASSFAGRWLQVLQLLIRRYSVKLEHSLSSVIASAKNYDEDGRTLFPPSPSRVVASCESRMCEEEHREELRLKENKNQNEPKYHLPKLRG